VSEKKTNWADKQARNNIWITPQDELDYVRRYGRIGLDPCTEPDNPAGAVHFYAEDDDGLSKPWSGRGLVFVNPPYSTIPPIPDDATKEKAAEIKRAYMAEIKDKGEAMGIARGQVSSLIVLWAHKIAREVVHGTPLIALLPCGARFGTRYWQECILSGELRAVCFVAGRIKFVDASTGKVGKGNNYDSMFYGYNVDPDRFCAVFSERGACFSLQRHLAKT